eukprot:6728628-Prymnesium_polylepis.1
MPLGSVLRFTPLRPISYELHTRQRATPSNIGSSQVAAVQKLHKTFIPRLPHRSTPAVAAGVLGARQR